MVNALFQLGLSISYESKKSERGLENKFAKPSKAYCFDNANKISSSNTTSGSANFNGTVISVFSFGGTDETTTAFNVSKGDPKKKLELPEYYANIEPVDNQLPVVPSVSQDVLVGDASSVDENTRNGELLWMNRR